VLQRGDDPSSIKRSPQRKSQLPLSACRRRSVRRPRLVNGRLRVPFRDYQRRSATADHGGETDYAGGTFGPQHGLTPQQAWIAQQRLTRALERRRREGRPWKGPWLAAIIAGVVSSVKAGRVGNAAWGWTMHGRRGGLTIARHAPHHLRAIAAAGARASVIARARRRWQAT
jgi:hypothetical protein